MSYLELKGTRIGYGQAEDLAKRFIEELEELGILKPIKNRSWMLNYPEFRKQPTKPEAPAKPAVAATRPAAATAVGQTTSAIASKPPVVGAQ
jgi:hypothetical protein